VKKETVSGSGISWAICKSASSSREITMPAPHHSVFYRPDARSLLHNQQRLSTEGKTTTSIHKSRKYSTAVVCDKPVVSGQTCKRWFHRLMRQKRWCLAPGTARIQHQFIINSSSSSNGPTDRSINQSIMYFYSGPSNKITSEYTGEQFTRDQW